MPNGKSQVEVTLKVGPGVDSNAISAQQNGIKVNGGELKLSNGASASLVSTKILSSGMSRNYSTKIVVLNHTLF